MNPGSRYVRMLQQGQPNLNNGTVAGGLAHMLQQGLKGYAGYKADEEEKQRKEQAKTRLAAALTQALPTSPEAQAMSADPLSGGGAQMPVNDQRYGSPDALAELMLTPETQGVGNMMLAQAMKGPADRRVIQGADGFNYYQDTGERVLPGVQAKPKDPVLKTVRGVGLVDVTDPQNPRVVQPEAPGTSGGPFEGTGMDAQLLNVLLTGDPASPVYRAAYAHYARPKTAIDPATGAMTSIQPDMSGFRAPPQSGTDAPTDDGMLPGTPRITVTPGQATKFSEGQGKAAGFADRMQSANGILATMDTQGTSGFNRFLEDVPLGNYAQSDEYQKFEQAKRDFINAQLRRESGAAIAPSEFESAERQYFPVPGDGPEVIEQKRRAREIAIQAMMRDAGPAYGNSGGPRIERYNPATGELEPVE